MDPADTDEELAAKLTVELLPYDPRVADEALEALAEYLVSMWLAERKRAQNGSSGGSGAALPRRPDP